MFCNLLYYLFDLEMVKPVSVEQSNWKIVCMHIWVRVVASECQAQQLYYLSSKISTVIGRIHCQQKIAQNNIMVWRENAQKKSPSHLNNKSSFICAPLLKAACSLLFFYRKPIFSFNRKSKAFSTIFFYFAIDAATAAAGLVYWPLYELPTTSTCTHSTVHI